MRITKAILFMVVALACLPMVSGAQEKKCDTPEDMMVEISYEHLSDWHKVHESYKTYKQCDDGFIAEGYSDTIVRLLANKMNKFMELATIVGVDHGFKEFVLKHIDTTTDDDDIKNIILNVQNSCPEGAQELCGQVGSIAKKILSELQDIDN